MLLKCADIGHLAADVLTHKRWAYQLEEEFFQQVGPHLMITPRLPVLARNLKLDVVSASHQGHISRFAWQAAAVSVGYCGSGSSGNNSSELQDRMSGFVGMQGDKERACGLTVSPLMDRGVKGGMTRSQVSDLGVACW